MFQKSPYNLVSIGTVVARTETRDPRRGNPGEFRYVDIGSISNESLAITDPKTLSTGEAPSRARKVIRANDVIFATTRPYLKGIAVVPQELDNQICSTGFCVLRASDRILPEWVFYCAISDDFMGQIAPLMRGGNYPAVTDKDVLAAKIPLPELTEQLRVVTRIRECISRADELRALRIEGLREVASVDSAIFGDVIESWTADGAPKGIPLGEVLVNVQYGTSCKANCEQRGVAVLRMGNIKNGELDVTDLKHIELSEKEIAKYRLNDGDILINRTNSLELVGKAAMFTGLPGDWVFASYLVRLIVNRKKALPDYVTTVINSRIGRDFVLKTARRAIGMVNINAQEIRRFPIPLPGLKVQEEIVEKVNAARTLTRHLRSEMDTLPIDGLPQSILRKAFAGEL